MSKLFRRPESDVWYVRLPDGSRRSTGCSSKRAAQARLAELELDAADPAHAAASAATLQEILDDYYRSRVRLGRAEGSLHHVRTKSGNLLRVLTGLGVVRARDITHDVLTRYQDKRAAEGARATTIAKELRVFGATWKLARKNKKVLTPIDELMPEFSDDKRAGTRALSPWELVAIATQLPAVRMAVIAFACATGCDFSALWRARPEDVSADFSLVHIRGTKRTSRDRIVPIQLPEQRALLAWVMAQPRPEGGKLLHPWPNNLARGVHAACRRAGIPKCSPNDWRRTFGTWLRETGVQPHLIGSAMGHADSRMVERVYGKLTPEALERTLQEELRRLGVIVTPKDATGADDRRWTTEATNASAQDAPGNAWTKERSESMGERDDDARAMYQMLREEVGDQELPEWEQIPEENRLPFVRATNDLIRTLAVGR